MNGRPANNQENWPEPVEPEDLDKGGIIQVDDAGTARRLVKELLDQVELPLFAKAGLPCAEIIATATANAAEKVGKRDSMGTIAVDSAADAVLLDADPLSDITRLTGPGHRRAVINAGHLVRR
ncbi:amidohydrolase family protein [Amycolatopsis sp. NBC_01480]|uniref:amidohydrolase family protein n=1 Tax=Amycolatopsis sp. NBC_01480 TaxID=2903562 RepID=UPI002E2DF9F7|nr:amidohydrolase family protein [Amycolatopsis sp. NBC_01480]